MAKKVKLESTMELILLDIRSVQNTASLFRTADCAGVSKIYLVGTTPPPVDRFKRIRADFAKISLGAEKTMLYEYVADITPLLKKLKKEKYQIVALELDQQAVDYKKYRRKDKVALILGNEVDGVPKKILKQCDVIIEISMKGKKESLNVSVAGAVALFGIA